MSVWHKVYRMKDKSTTPYTNLKKYIRNLSLLDLMGMCGDSYTTSEHTTVVGI